MKKAPPKINKPARTNQRYPGIAVSFFFIDKAKWKSIMSQFPPLFCK